MLKGCSKKVIFVKLTDNCIYEEAYFVVRPGTIMLNSEEDLLSEARKIISDGCTEKQSSPKKQKSSAKIKKALHRLLCFACGAAFSTAILLLFMLFGKL